MASKCNGIHNQLPIPMNATRRIGSTLAFLAAASLFLVGCSDPQKQARKGIEAKGYEVSVDDLLVAAASGDVESLEMFLSAGLDIDAADAAGNTALIKAAGSGHLPAVERILGLGADPRHVNGSGRDALITASAKGHEEVARMLLGRGADTTLRDSESWGALSIAAYNGHAKVVSLLAGGATAAELDDALLVASFSGDARVINTLLGQGANINARSPESKTPLMIASEAGKLEAVRVLLQNQANPYAVDLENRTAANLAQASGHEEITKLISDPESWGSSLEGVKVAGEMAKAQEALLRGIPVEETLREESRTTKTDAAAGGTGVPENSIAGSDPGRAGESTGRIRPEGAGTEKGSAVATRKETVPSSKGTMLVAEPVEAAALKSTNPPRGDRAARIEESRRVREESVSKPIVTLNGSTLHSRTPAEAPVKSMVLAAYHEESLPLLVEGVDGSTAEVRRLDGGGDTVAVAKGAVIPGTSYKVQEVTPVYVSSKEGKGRMVDVSRVKVEDTRTGSTHVLVKDSSGQTADTYAILTAPNSRYRYVVKAGDVFRTSQPDLGAKDYQVLEIRASGVVIKDLATGEVTTVARDGAVTP